MLSFFLLLLIDCIKPGSKGNMDIAKVAKINLSN